jgi:hypothetical protein
MSVRGCAQVTVKRYSTNLRSILLLPVTRAYFRDHLRREHAEENIEARPRARAALMAPDVRAASALSVLG